VSTIFIAYPIRLLAIEGKIFNLTEMFILILHIQNATKKI